MIISILPIILSGTVLSGCASEAIVTAFKSVFNLQPAKVWLEKVHFKAADNVNDTSPLTIHIVIVYKADLLAEILKLDADAYFNKIDQIKIDNPGQLDIFSWDIVRGQTLSDIPIEPSKVSGEGVVVFARYSSPGPHRALIGGDKEVTIQLDKKDFKVIPPKAK